MRTLILSAVLLASPALGQSGWSVEKGAGTAAMLFGKPETANAFRLDCSAKGTSLSTWTRRLPRNVIEGEFPTSLRVFQGNREIVIGSTGTVMPAGGTRIDGMLDNAPTFFDAMARNGRFVVVTFAGRATAPAPSSALIDQFRAACQEP